MKAHAHPDLELSGTRLLDTALGTEYILTPDAAWLFLQLRRQPDIMQLTDITTRRKRVSRAEAAHAIYALLGLLDRFGCVRMHWHGVVDRLLGLRTRSMWNRRYAGTIAGFVRSMARAYGFLLCILTMPLLAYDWIANITVAPAWFLVPGLLFVSCIAHEVGHMVAARHYKVPHIFLARMAGAAIMYHQPTRRKARMIAACGPIAALGWCAAGIGIVGLHLIGYLFLTTGIIHALSLTPFFADGRTLWRNT